MNTPHTPSLKLPLRIVPQKGTAIVDIVEADGRLICPCDEQDAPEIVRAVNSHADLVEACKGLNGLTYADCDQCDGTGKNYHNQLDACSFCGGVGQVVKGFFHPDELLAIRNAIAKAEGRQI